MAPGLPDEAANEVDQYEQVAEEVNYSGSATNSTLSYDVRGNLISDTVWTYTYDLENRLLTATASGTLCSGTCAYAYDPMGRRVSKTVGATVTKFLRAGPAEIAEYDSSGNLLRRYVPGAGPDTFVVWIEGTGTTSASMKWILADRQGSVAVVTDNAGKATQRFAYDPFGNEVAGASGTGFPFRYTGQRFDPETGLYYYKARYYSAKLGRFLQTDPVGYKDNLNLYAYVGNSPMNATDPTGTCEASRLPQPTCVGGGWNYSSGGGNRSVNLSSQGNIPIKNNSGVFRLQSGTPSFDSDDGNFDPNKNQDNKDEAKQRRHETNAWLQIAGGIVAVVGGIVAIVAGLGSVGVLAVLAVAGGVLAVVGGVIAIVSGGLNLRDANDEKKANDDKKNRNEIPMDEGDDRQNKGWPLRRLYQYPQVAALGQLLNIGLTHETWI